MNDSLKRVPRLKACIGCGIPYSIARKNPRCVKCEAAREAPRVGLSADVYFKINKARFKKQPGVDIDRIHYKLGKVKIRKAA